MSLKFPPALEELISYLKKLPGVGSRTAERFAFELLEWTGEDLNAFGKMLSQLKCKIVPCPTCGALQEEVGCRFCSSGRDLLQLCLLSSPKDIYAIEDTHSFSGLYHVIDHLISPLDGKYAETIGLEKLEKRILENGVEELIIAFDATIEADATALYLKKHFSSHPNLKISRLAFGIPVGSSLEYIDGGTLLRALQGRRDF